MTHFQLQKFVKGILTNINIFYVYRLISLVDTRIQVDPLTLNGVFPNGMNKEERQRYSTKLKRFK